MSEYTICITAHDAEIEVSAPTLREALEMHDILMTDEPDAEWQLNEYGERVYADE